MIYLKRILLLNISLFFISCSTPSLNKEGSTSASKKPQNFVSSGFLKTVETKANIRIAVMPIPKEGLSLNLAKYCRKTIMDKLEQKGYGIIDAQKLDKKLQQFGLDKPSKLSKIDQSTLRALTSADFLLYGKIHNNSEGGIRQYVGSLLIQDLNKENMWSSLSSLNIEKKHGIDPLKMAIDYLVTGGVSVIGIVLDFGKSTDEEYKNLSFYMDTLLSSLPDGPREIILDEGLLEQATEI